MSTTRNITDVVGQIYTNGFITEEDHKLTLTVKMMVKGTGSFQIYNLTNNLKRGEPRRKLQRQQ